MAESAARHHAPYPQIHRGNRSGLLASGAILLIFGLLAPALAASEEASIVVPLRVEKVALFKNGLAHFSGEVELPDDATSVEIHDLPTPVHGTFWVEYDEKTPLRGVFSRLGKETSQQPVQSLSALLAANVGKTVRLEPGNIVGELVSAEQLLALVRTDSGTIAVSPNRLEQVLIEGDAVASTTEVETDRQILRLELEKPAGGRTVSVNFLAKGMTWAPSYSIELGDGGLARLSSKAVVINEALDLDGVTFELVTGFPHLLFSDVDSPIAPAQTLHTFMRALREGRTSRPSPAAMTQQRVMYNHAPAAARPGPTYSTRNDSRGSEDLFFYPVPGIDLQRREKVSLDLVESRVPYRHVYTWQIPDFFDREQRRYQEPDATREETVWHVCRLTNTTDIPLTTAPAQFLKDGRIVGQDLLGFTAIGTESDIRINRALGLRAEQAEFEVRRQQVEERIHGDYYDRISIRGELKLFNGLGKSARVEVTKDVSGDLGSISHDPRRTRTTRGLRAVNPSYSLRWTLDLEADEALSIHYEYAVLVRR